MPVPRVRPQPIRQPGISQGETPTPAMPDQGGSSPVDVRKMAGDQYRGALLRRMNQGGGAAQPQAPQAPLGGQPGQPPDVKQMLTGLLGSRNKRRVLGGGSGLGR